MKFTWIRKDGAWYLLNDGKETGYVVHRSQGGHSWVDWPDGKTFTMGLSTARDAKAEAERLAAKVVQDE